MLPEDIVEDIIKSQFDFIRGTIKSGDMTDPDSFKNINIKYLGKLFVKKSRIEIVNAKINGAKAAE